MDIEERYQAELAQSDRDHHKPTAGAMTGHILANQWIMEVKLHQALWFVHGMNAPTVQALYRELIAANRQALDELGALLLDENELPPVTTAEVTAYNKIDEEPRLKYADAATLVDTTAHDLTTANMFIDRAIKLAEREDRPVLAQHLIGLRGTNNRHIRALQTLLGKSAWDGLVEIDDDDDDDD